MKAVDSAAGPATEPVLPVMSLDEILDAQGVEYREVAAWGGRKIGIMSITAGEVLEWIDEREGPNKRESGLRLIARSLVGPDRTRICKSKVDEERMIESLKGKDSRTCNAITLEIIDLNGIAAKPADVKNDSGATS